jgi:hypothetical protein
MIAENNPHVKLLRKMVSQVRVLPEVYVDVFFKKIK